MFTDTLLLYCAKKLIKFVYRSINKQIIVLSDDYGCCEIVKKINYIDKCNEVVNSYEEDDFVFVDIRVIESL